MVVLADNNRIAKDKASEDEDVNTNIMSVNTMWYPYQPFYHQELQLGPATRLSSRVFVMVKQRACYSLHVGHIVETASDPCSCSCTNQKQMQTVD
jgi:hypothetical protein